MILKYEEFINESKTGKEIIDMMDKGRNSGSTSYLLSVYAALKNSKFKDAVKYMDDHEDHGDWSKINPITLAKIIISDSK